jgi:hypothetical protein
MSICGNGWVHWVDRNQKSAPTVNLPGLGERPEWHESAACRGSGAAEWIVERGSPRNQMRTLAAVCRGCPVSGECLREAVGEPIYDRVGGPLRVGVTGERWRAVFALVDELGVESGDDFAVLAAWLLDGVIVWRKLSARRWSVGLVEVDRVA